MLCPAFRAHVLDALRVLSELPLGADIAHTSTDAKTFIVREGERATRSASSENGSEQPTPMNSSSATRILVIQNFSSFSCHASYSAGTDSNTHQPIPSNLLALSKPWEDAFRTFWIRVVSATQDPPDTQIIVAGTDPRGAAPVHDRWLLTNNGGLTSWYIA
jgi:hypothetical protein